VALRLPVEDDIVLIGPGTMREHLERRIRETDERQHRTRRVTTEASTRLTDRQLLARLHRLGGVEPRRRTVGAYRWSVKPTKRPSGAPARLSRRVLEKPPRDLDPGER
jgi:hypothetical protein